MKKSFKKLIPLLLALVMLYCCVGCSFINFVQPDEPPTVENVPADSFTPLETALAYIKEVFPDELTDEQMLAAAINGANAILATYDNYGFILTPQQYYELRHPVYDETVGSYFGFSFSQVMYLGLRVSTVLTDSSAYKAGLESGDVIVGITHTDGSVITYTDENDVEHVLNPRTTPLETLSECLNAAGETPYRFETLRGGSEEFCYEDGQKLNFDIVRGTVYNENENAENKMYYVEYYGGYDNKGNLIGNVSAKTMERRSLGKLTDTNVGYIRILEFSVTTVGNKTVKSSDEVERALTLLKKAGKTQIILDLQGNPGGRVDEVETISSFFARKEDAAALEQILIYTLKYRDGESQGSVLSKYNKFFGDGMNIVVLTDGHSASGSEMLTGVIRDYGTGVQVGTTTFGKGIAQNYAAIEDLTGIYEVNGEEIVGHYGIYYTTAYYYSPNGDNIHGIGYTPDEENIVVGYLAQIERALTLLGH